jgi:hypothetical protein
MTQKGTSLLAYRKLVESGSARTQRDKVFECLLKHSNDGMALCRRQIAGELGMMYSSVCGRVNELLDMEFIRIKYEDNSPYEPHNEVEFLEVTPIVIAGEQIQMFPQATKI